MSFFLQKLSSKPLSYFTFFFFHLTSVRTWFGFIRFDHPLHSDIIRLAVPVLLPCNTCNLPHRFDWWRCLQLQLVWLSAWMAPIRHHDHCPFATTHQLQWLQPNRMQSANVFSGKLTISNWNGNHILSFDFIFCFTDSQVILLLLFDIQAFYSPLTVLSALYFDLITLTESHFFLWNSKNTDEKPVRREKNNFF